MDRLPLWLSNPKYYDKTFSNSSSHLQAVLQVLKSVGFPRLDFPPDQKRDGGYYVGSWTWTWLLNPSPSNEEEYDLSIPFLRCRMDVHGRAELWFSAGRYSPDMSVVAGRWGAGHKFKYSYLNFVMIKHLWEALSDHDVKRFEELIHSIHPRLYTKQMAKL